MKKAFVFVSILVVLSMVLSGCAQPTPQVIEKTVQVEVVKTVEVPKEVEVIKTVEVQKEVEVIKTVEVEKQGAVQLGYGAPELSGGQGVIMGGMLKGAQGKGWGVTPTNANFDAATQANQIDYFISLGVSAITVVPVDSQAICASAKKAKDAGIAFFTIDRAPIGCEIDMTVQSDNYMAGKQSAEAMVKLLTEKYGEPKGTVLELQGDLGQNVAQLRGGGFNDEMKKYPNIKVISKPTEWKAEKFSQATLDVVAAEAVDGIYMHSDCVGTKVVLAALEQLGKKFPAGDKNHIFLTGVDGCADALAAIRDGFSDEASSQPLPDFGVVIADYIQKVLNGEAIAEGTVTQDGALWSPAQIVKSETGFMMNLATTMVTKENAEDPALWGNQAK
jgi:ABC-type sugar transport system substrate-binding protein